MTQVKILKNKHCNLLERDINEYLFDMDNQFSLKRSSGFYVKDIKIEYSESNNMYIALIIYELMN